MLFSQVDEQTVNRRARRGERKGTDLNQLKAQKRAEEQEYDGENIFGGMGRRTSKVHSKERDDEDRDVMGSIEIKQKQQQQLQRLRKKAPAPPADCQRKVTDHKTNKPQPRPAKIGGTRGTRVAFREREPTRRRVPA